MSSAQLSWRRRQVKSTYHRPTALPRVNWSGARPVLSHRKKRSSRHWLRAIVVLGLLAVGIGMTLFVGAFFYYSRGLPTMAQIRAGVVEQAESTKIFDRTGKRLLYTIHGEENRTKISLAQIPDYIKWATIATEDQNFYTRGFAIDWHGLGRAVLAVVRNHDLSGPGGSTITQQVVRNLVLTREKTIARKIKEIILSFRIEKAFSRDEILELYLNQIPYGSNAYGIEQAARTFFNKSASEITISEAAALAVLPKATTYYSPFGSHRDGLIERQKIVLKQMLTEGYISEDEWQAASKEPVNFTSGVVNMEAPHFVIYVKELLAKKYGENELEQGGLRVITTLDYELQQVAEKAVSAGAAKNEALNADNAALVSIDPKSGQVLAMVGSRDYFDTAHQGNFNVVLAGRQPGSSFKPFVYATLFTKGYTPNTKLFDVQTDFAPSASQEYIPRNYDGKEHGIVSIRQALAGSLNIPAVKALYLADILTVLDNALKLGYTTLDDPERVGLSLALGSGDVVMLEHVAAYGVLANDGVRQNTAVILKVEQADGVVLEEFKPGPGARVFPENAVRQVTDILTDAKAREFAFGANSNLTVGDQRVAVKTGTTNDYRDAWTLGYTPDLVAGVWVGNNDNSEMKHGGGGAMAAAPIWDEFMTAALQKIKATPFPGVTISTTGKPIIDGTQEFVKIVRLDKVSGKLASEFTPADSIKEVKYIDYHCILQYVDRKNPLGPEPADPNLDPQYANWEAAVARWVAAQVKDGKIKSDQPPTDIDDVHRPEYAPTVEILEPLPQAIISEDSVLVEVQAQAPRGISVVEFYIDAEFRESAGLFPYSRRVYFGNLADGQHTILVKAADDAGNAATQKVSIILNRGLVNDNQPAVKFLSPADGATITVAEFPLDVRLSLSGSDQIRQLNLFFNDVQGNPLLIDSVTENLSSELTFTWNQPPDPGAYNLYAIWLDEQNVSHRSQIKLTITNL